MKPALVCLYQLGAIATWVFLTFFSGFHYNWWNWIVAVTINPFLAEIWPLYWVIIVPLMYVLDPLLWGR